MTKGKGRLAEGTQGSNHNVRWTDEMDRVLLNAFLEEDNKGNRHDGNWTTEAYANVLEILRSNIDQSMTKNHIKNRQKTLKENFGVAYDLFHSLSGFAWDPITKKFEAEESVWEDLIKEKPHAVKWKKWQIKHYDALLELYGSDRATGKQAQTARQILRQPMKDNTEIPHHHHDPMDLNDLFGDDSMRDTRLPSFDEQRSPQFESFTPPYTQSQQSSGTSGSRGVKRKTAAMSDLIEAQVEKMSSGLAMVADVLKDGNSLSEKLLQVAQTQVEVAKHQVEIAARTATAVEKRNEIAEKHVIIIQNSTPCVYTEADVWEMLSELNVVDHIRLQCYEFLCNNDSKKRQIFGVPSHVRMQALYKMMTDAGYIKQQ